jgi:phosphate transport system substrate-binding protein
MTGIFFRFFALPFLVTGLFISCKNKAASNPENSDTPISGKIKILADASFAPLIKSEITTFSAIYPEATIDAGYLPEKQVTDSFFSSGKIRLMIIARRLQENEKSYFTKMGLPPREIKIAIDALALIVHDENPDTNLTYQQVIDLLNGRIDSWKQIDSSSALGKITVVFDNKLSSTVRYVNEELLKGQPLTSNAFAADSNSAVIDYVSNNPSAIGVLGASWIIDRSDSSNENFSKKIRVVSVSSGDSSGSFYLPSKRFIYSMKYPFLRELFIISQEKHDGLGTGFATYVASDEGQRIVQRFGLLPIDNAVRIIEIQNQF